MHIVRMRLHAGAIPPLFQKMTRSTPSHLCDCDVLVLSRLHEPHLQRRDAVLQLLHLGTDARQLLVGALKLAVGLCQRSALGRDDLGEERVTQGLAAPQPDRSVENREQGSWR